MAIVSGFEIRVAVLHDSGPRAPCERDVEMAYAAPIGRIDGVKSLVPRQFLADFAAAPAFVPSRSVVVGKVVHSPEEEVAAETRPLPVWLASSLRTFSNVHRVKSRVCVRLL